MVEQLNDQNLIEYIRKWATGKGGLSAGERYVTVMDTEILPGIHDTVMVTEL